MLGYYSSTENKGSTGQVHVYEYSEYSSTK
jgi:hypothetical protein